MKFLEKGVYKIFGAVVLVSMIGALVAESVAVGDLGAAYYYKYHDDKGYLEDGREWGDCGAELLLTVSEVESVEGAAEVALWAAAGLTGAGLIAVGVTLIC
ncbi:hypothetical protein Metvu_0328 [Methanocaldococcus vulcanius M7]|uniref:Uncharacterized protein n=1 Tax=Methanocaldococcus vulcanius (strain ATCC 700851 / DSM 12094 / M7) TaxID=579137 RepID=C9RF43_METVM|nr:hypothetical protein [Methanocaldococcus vulcanius]ACX72195.1 hypothetical protein Metvu_0328 [Methanocaldococcus vulcanius M7]